MFNDDHSGLTDGREEVDGAGTSPQWRDRLVELHVLAEHGDPAATAAAGRWLAGDAEARRVWNDVERTCDRLRGVEP